MDSDLMVATASHSGAESPVVARMDTGSYWISLSGGMFL